MKILALLTILAVVAILAYFVTKQILPNDTNNNPVPSTVAIEAENVDPPAGSVQFVLHSESPW